MSSASSSSESSDNARSDADGAPAPAVTRRGFLAASGSTLALSGLGVSASDAQAPDSPSAPEDGLIATTITINGVTHTLRVDPRTTVLDLLREGLGLTGTKVGCNHGQCGACTILLGGVRVNSCFVLAAAANGKSIVTVEGLASADGELHPMQRAFVEKDAFQCGYCTPGQIVSAVGCVMEGHAGSEKEIREYMSGNLCRCGAYKGIVEAVREAREATSAMDVARLAVDGS